MAYLYRSAIARNPTRIAPPIAPAPPVTTATRREPSSGSGTLRVLVPRVVCRVAAGCFASFRTGVAVASVGVSTIGISNALAVLPSHRLVSDGAGRERWRYDRHHRPVRRCQYRCLARLAATLLPRGAPAGPRRRRAGH